MRFPTWGKVLLWLEVVLVFFINLWLTPYAVLLAWGIPLLWERWHQHLNTVEEMVYLVTGAQQDRPESAEVHVEG